MLLQQEFRENFGIGSFIQRARNSLKFIYKTVLSEPETPFYLQAYKRTTNQELELWTSDFRKIARVMQEKINKKANPVELRDYLLQWQAQLTENIKSPIYYDIILRQLEIKVGNKAPVQMSYVLQEARARLREKLQARPNIARSYFYKEINFQLFQLSMQRINLTSFKNSLAYYKRLVSKSIYSTVIQLIDQTNFEVEYEQGFQNFQQQVDVLFQSSFQHKRAQKKTGEDVNWQFSFKNSISTLCQHSGLMLLGVSAFLISQMNSNKYNKPSLSRDILWGINTINFPPLIFSSLNYWALQQLQAGHATTWYFHVAALVPHLVPVSAKEINSFVTQYGWNNADIATSYNIISTMDKGSLAIGATKTTKQMFLVKFTNEGELAWNVTISDVYFYKSYVQQLTDQNYITASGISFSPQGTKHILLTNWNPEGLLNWAQRWYGFSNNVSTNNEATCVQALSDGSFVATGYVQLLPNVSSTFLGKWYVNGTLAWINALNWGINFGEYVQPLSDNTFLTIGYGSNNLTDQDILVSHWAGNGTLLWAGTYGTPANEYGLYILEASDKNYVLTGSLGNKQPELGLGSFIAKINSNGTLIWSYLLEAPSHFRSVLQNENGEYLTPGGFYVSNDNRIKPTLMTWSPNGSLHSVQVYGPGNSSLVSMQYSPDSGYILLGEKNATSNENSLLIKVNSRTSLQRDCSIVAETISFIAPTQLELMSNLLNITMSSVLLSMNLEMLQPLSASLKTVRICPPLTKSERSIPALLIGVIAMASVFGLGAIVASIVLPYWIRKKKKEEEDNLKEKKVMEIQLAAVDEKDRLQHIDYKNIQKLEKIGEGASGHVYKVQIGNNILAAKEYQEAASETEFRREVTDLAKLRHPNIIALYGFSIDGLNKNGPIKCIIMDYMPMGSLAKVLNEQHELLDWERRHRIALGVIEAIKFAHSMDRIHADIKTNNILLDSNYTPKLCDFGMNWQQSNIHDQRPRGTGFYIAPELRSIDSGSVPEATKSSDVYSYGVVLYELMNKDKNTQITADHIEKLYDRKADEIGHDLFNDCPENEKPEMADLIKKCTAKAAAERPNSDSIASILAKMHVINTIASDVSNNNNADNKRSENLTHSVI